MTIPIIELKLVSFKYKNGDQLALKKISLKIQQGDFILLAGFSGSGKSTFLKCINGLIPHFHSGSFGGEVFVDGINTLKTTTAQLAKKVGFVFQNPENQLSNLTIEREIAFPLENFGLPRNEIRERIEELIQIFELEKIRFKSPDEISGGEQQLTAIAAALALDPPILILDEVTSHLSPKSAEKILLLLVELNKKYHKTIVLTEHRLDRCIHLVNKIAFMKDGELLSYGSPREILYNENFPEEMLPKIPALFKKISKENLIEIKENEESEEQPLSASQLVSILKQKVVL